jgi:hypothetical protein
MSTPKARTDVAQAVYEAAHNAWVTKDDPSSIAVAALRVAAHQLSHDRRQLAAIATELEGHHG